MKSKVFYSITGTIFTLCVAFLAVSSILNLCLPPLAEAQDTQRVEELIIGRWQSVDDEARVMEFFPDGSVLETTKKTESQERQSNSLSFASMLTGFTNQITGDYRFPDR